MPTLKTFTHVGFQIRHFGAKYESANADYTNCGVDQLKRALELIRRDWTTRRAFVSYWNPCDLERMAAEPCHTSFHLLVFGGRLSMSVVQRSGDIGLGVPYNIAFYGLLLCIFAHHLGLKRGTLDHTINDAHIYSKHVKVLEQQTTARQYPSPDVEVSFDSLDEVSYNFIRLVNYKCGDSLPMEMFA